MTALRFPRATYALLAFGLALTPAAAAQAPEGVSLQLTSIDAPVIAGHDIGLSFSVTNGSDQPIDRIVAIVTDPKGRTLSTRTLHGGDIAPGASLSKSPTRRIPENTLPGTYALSLEALAADGTALARVPRVFDILSTTRAFATPGMDVAMPYVSAQVMAGTDVEAQIQLSNATPHTVDRVYAVVIDPDGRLMRARTIHSGDISPSGTLARRYTERVPARAKAGTYQVQLQSRSTDGVILSTVPFSFEVMAPTAGLRASEPLTAFPNPAATRATLRFALDQDTDATLAVYDALGRQVQQPLRGAVLAGRTDTEIDVAGLAPGLYVARLALRGGDTQVARFTVAR